MLTALAADTTNKQQTTLTGNEIIIARNSGATSHTVTITSTPDRSSGRSGDITGDSLAAGVTKMYGPFPLDGWRQTNGKIYFEANHVEILFSVIEL